MINYSFAADQRELGEYALYVKQIRDNNGLLSDESMVAVMQITPSILRIIRQVISEHPDWDDEEVADEVIFMEEQEQQ
ncbi:MAG: hypothetical protein J6M92_16705 [Oribacterium sp.]|nr:hypothetical protein [Oribacterium sp.]